MEPLLAKARSESSRALTLTRKRRAPAVRLLQDAFEVGELYWLYKIFIESRQKAIFFFFRRTVTRKRRH